MSKMKKRIKSKHQERRRRDIAFGIELMQYDEDDDYTAPGFVRERVRAKAEILSGPAERLKPQTGPTEGRETPNTNQEQ